MKISTRAGVAGHMLRMIEYSGGNRRDIDHFMRVWACARTIGELEGLDSRTQYILEVAAIVHDIACPLCRAKYGSAEGRLQELEGGPLAREFLRDTGMADDVVDRVAFLVAHHHTYKGVEGMDWQILLEADYIVNAEESGYSQENIRAFRDHLCRTDAGRALIQSILIPND